MDCFYFPYSSSRLCREWRMNGRTSRCDPHLRPVGGRLRCGCNISTASQLSELLTTGIDASVAARSDTAASSGYYQRNVEDATAAATADSCVGVCVLIRTYCNCLAVHYCQSTPPRFTRRKSATYQALELCSRNSGCPMTVVLEFYERFGGVIWIRAKWWEKKGGINRGKFRAWLNTQAYAKVSVNVYFRRPWV